MTTTTGGPPPDLRTPGKRLQDLAESTSMVVVLLGILGVIGGVLLIMTTETGLDAYGDYVKTRPYVAVGMGVIGSSILWMRVLRCFLNAIALYGRSQDWAAKARISQTD